MRSFADPRDRLPSKDLCLYTDQAVNTPRYDGLKTDITADICVIGGGFTGLSAAYHLVQKGYNVVLLERHRIGWGASGRNSGQLIPGFNTDIRDIAKKYGETVAAEAYQATVQTLSFIKKTIQENAIECDLKQGLVIAAPTEKSYRDLSLYRACLQNLCGYDTDLLSREETAHHIGTDYYKGALKDGHAARFNPFRYITQMAALCHKAGVRIFEESPALKINHMAGHILIDAPDSVVKADKVVLAGDAYLGNLVPALRKKYILVRTSMLATNILRPDVSDKILPCDHAVFEWCSLLNYYQKTSDGRLIFGGGDSPVFSNRKQEERAFKTIYDNMTRLFPILHNIHPTHWWGGYMAVTRDQLPEISHIDDRIFYAFGYSGHGVVPSHMAGRILADMIGNTKEIPQFTDYFKAADIPMAGRQDHFIAQIGLMAHRFRDFWH